MTALTLRLRALEHAQALLDQEREAFLCAEHRHLITLINPGEADDSALEDYIARVEEVELELNGRYQSAFNKVVFEVDAIERLS